MVAIRLSAMVSKDRRLIVDLPDDVPVGPVELIVQPLPVNQAPSVRELLLAAGVLAHYDDLDEDADYVADDELEQLGTLPPGSPSALELIDDDRGPR
jgi:hypothetical protein